MLSYRASSFQTSGGVCGAGQSSAGRLRESAYYWGCEATPPIVEFRPQNGSVLRAPIAIPYSPRPVHRFIADRNQSCWNASRL